jgi:signal peptidase
MALVRDVVTALVVVIIILLSLWAWGGRWPPMVVVESGSMQHLNDASIVGVIDTGDLTFVRTLERADGVITWVEGQERGYERYGDFGDVIIYHKNGITETTPIIHRALVWIEWNETTNGFDVPSLNVTGNINGFFIWNLTTYDYDTGERDVVDFWVDVPTILNNFSSTRREVHGGYITKGDHNGEVDQTSLNVTPTGGKVEPVMDEWIVGVARGELPWFGLIKLWANDQIKVHPPPANSGYNLMITVGLLVIVPLLIDMAVIEYRRWRPKPKKEEERRPRRRGRRREEPEPSRNPLVRSLSVIRDRLLPPFGREKD